jgi:hypothetical protein
MNGLNRKLLIALSFISSQFAFGQDNVHEFPQHHCRFTLPDKGWRWTPVDAPDLVFSAEGPRGISVHCSATRPVPANVRLNSEFIRGFEQALFPAGQHENRGGGFVEQDGHRWYQALGTFIPARSSATRLILRGGESLTFMVLGGEQPVESDVEFEPAVRSLELLPLPGDAPDNPTGEGEPIDLGELVGNWVGRILFYVAVICAAIWVVRRTRTSSN